MPPVVGASVVGASIDVGSNSVHLLVATIDGPRLSPLVDESVFLGLGAAVQDHGVLGNARLVDLIDALSDYSRIARDRGASFVTVVGTEPLRRAGDGPTVVRTVQGQVGLDLHVLTYEEEALLTVVGLTGGRSVEHETLVVDVGGGSSAFCLIGPTTTTRAWGMRLGAARLTSQHVHHDPPTMDELEAVRVDARSIIAEAGSAAPVELLGVGGTASNLLKVLRFGATTGSLDREGIARAGALLAEGPAEAIAPRHGIRPARARILPAGAVIVDELLRRYGVASLRVEESGIREGAILATARDGRAWRDRLTTLVRAGAG